MMHDRPLFPDDDEEEPRRRTRGGAALIGPDHHGISPIRRGFVQAKEAGLLLPTPPPSEAPPPTLDGRGGNRVTEGVGMLREGGAGEPLSWLTNVVKAGTLSCERVADGGRHADPTVEAAGARDTKGSSVPPSDEQQEDRSRMSEIDPEAFLKTHLWNAPRDKVQEPPPNISPSLRPCSSQRFLTRHGSFPPTHTHPSILSRRSASRSAGERAPSNLRRSWQAGPKARRAPAQATPILYRLLHHQSQDQCLNCNPLRKWVFDDSAYEMGIRRLGL